MALVAITVQVVRRLQLSMFGSGGTSGKAEGGVSRRSQFESRNVPVHVSSYFSSIFCYLSSHSQYSVVDFLPSDCLRKTLCSKAARNKASP